MRNCTNHLLLIMKKRLPNPEFRRLVPKLRERGFYKAQVKRPIDWHKYNTAQTEEAIKIS